MNRIVICFFLLVNSLAFSAVIHDSLYFNADLQPVQKRQEALAYILTDSMVSDGVNRLYYLDSNILFGEVKRNKRKFSGHYKLFHQNGLIRQKGELKKGRYHGLQYFYDVTAKLERGEIYSYRRGIVGQFYFSQSGKKVYSIADRLSTYSKKRSEHKALNELGKFVNLHLEKPSEANNYADPKVLVSFLIAPDGKLEEIHVSEGLHPLLDAAAIKVVSEMPKWRPAKFRGKSVYSEFSISIRF